MKYNLTFSELSMECKNALLAFCCEQYETLEEVEAFYRNRLFSIEIITVEEAKRRCMENSEGLDYYKGDFEAHHREYVGDGSDIPYHGDSVYPLISSCDPYEWIIDGWHRFHSYVKYGIQDIPILTIQDKYIPS